MAFRSLAIISALASVVLAQSNSLIPANISPGCAAYLSVLNNNTQIQSCLSPINTALAAFSPSANLPSCSSSTIGTALTSVCSSSACPQSAFTSQLGTFYANCTAELTSSPNPQVKLIYDALYSFFPFRQAICSKDDSGNYCVTKLSNSSSSQLNARSTLYDSHSTLSRRDSNSTQVPIPNVATFQQENILFLLLQPNMPSSELCSTCTRNILTPYIDFESNALYAPGLSQSELLLGQVNLYTNITSVCTSNFLSGAVSAAGGISKSVVSAASRIGVQELSTAMGALWGVAGLVAASL